jgi:putative Ig domain-containing protein
MATLIHKSLVSAGASAPPVKIATTALPVAHRGHPYRAKLATVSGTAPYGWTLLERAPVGIHLLVNGTIDGTPRAKPGHYAFNVEVRDAAGFLATRRLTLRITA